MSMDLNPLRTCPVTACHGKDTLVNSVAEDIGKGHGKMATEAHHAMGHRAIQELSDNLCRALLNQAEVHDLADELIWAGHAPAAARCTALRKWPAWPLCLRSLSPCRGTACMKQRFRSHQ